MFPKDSMAAAAGGGVLRFGNIDLIERNAIIKQCARLMVIGGTLHNTIYITIIYIYCVPVSMAREKVVYQIDFLFYYHYYLYIFSLLCSLSHTKNVKHRTLILNWCSREVMYGFEHLCRFTSCAGQMSIDCWITTGGFGGTLFFFYLWTMAMNV